MFPTERAEQSKVVNAGENATSLIALEISGPEPVKGSVALDGKTTL